MTRQRAINAKCKDCIYDRKNEGHGGNNAPPARSLTALSTHFGQWPKAFDEMAL